VNLEFQFAVFHGAETWKNRQIPKQVSKIPKRGQNFPDIYLMRAGEQGFSEMAEIKSAMTFRPAG
jgi:hypothetical protein